MTGMPFHWHWRGSVLEGGFFGNVGKRSIAIVFVKMRSGSFAGRPVGIETRSVGEIDVEPAVMVIIEKSDAAALGFDDVFFMIDAAPDIGDGQASFAGCVDEPYGRNRR